MSTKINTNVIIAILTLLATLFLVFTYRFPVFLNLSNNINIRDFYGDGNLQIYANGKIIQDRSSLGRYDREFLNNITIPFASVDGVNYVLYRPTPNKVKIQNKDYYYTLFSDRMILTEELDSFQEKVPVIFYENNVKNTLNSSLIDFVKSNFFDKYDQNKNCGQMNKVSTCDNLEFNQMNLGLSKEDTKLKINLSLNKNKSDSKVQLYNGVKLMQKWQLCDSINNCLKRDEPFRVTPEADFPIYFLRADGSEEKVEKFANLKLSDQDTFSLKLPDNLDVKDYYEPLLSFGENYKLQDYYDITYPGGVKVRVTPDKNQIQNIFVDQRYDLLLFQGKNCEPEACNHAFTVEIL